MTHTRRCGRRAALLAASVAVAAGRRHRIRSGRPRRREDALRQRVVRGSPRSSRQAGAPPPDGPAHARPNCTTIVRCACSRSAAPPRPTRRSRSAWRPIRSRFPTRASSPRAWRRCSRAARARLVPDVARAALADGRQLMQKGDATAANQRFEAVTRAAGRTGADGPGRSGRSDAGGQCVGRADARADRGGRGSCGRGHSRTIRGGCVWAAARHRQPRLQPHRQPQTRPPVTRRPRRPGRAHSRHRRPARQRRNRRPRVRPSGYARLPTQDSWPPCPSRRCCPYGAPDRRHSRTRVHGCGARAHRRHWQGHGGDDGAVRVPAVRSAGAGGRAQLDLSARHAQRGAGQLGTTGRDRAAAAALLRP